MRCFTLTLKFVSYILARIVPLCKKSLDVQKYGLEIWVSFPWHETSSFLAIAEAWYQAVTKGLGGSLAEFDTLMKSLDNGKLLAFV